MKKIMFIFTIILFLPMAILEGVMYIYNGPAKSELDPPFFKYYHVDIRKPFFKKAHMENGDVDIPQRLYDYFKHTDFFPALKTPNTVRIFILGGSVAHDWGNAKAPFLKDTLEDLAPDKYFEVINCGMDGYDSYRVSLVAKEVLSYEPDLIIILSGNNEVIHNPVKVNPTVYYLNKSLKRFWTYRKAQDTILERLRLRNQDSMHKIVSKKKLINYEKNLRLIVRMAKAKGVPVILATLPISLKDYPVFTEAPLDRQFLLARFLSEKGDYLNAINEINHFLKANPDDSRGFRLLGGIYEAKGDHQKAKKYYLKALDLSFGLGSPHVTPASNAMIRRICIEEEAGLADLEIAFMNIAQHGLTGRGQFWDQCHWYPELYPLLTEVFVREIIDNDTAYCSIFDPDKHRSDSFSIPNSFLWLKEYGNNELAANYRIQATIWNIVYSELIDKNVSNERTIAGFKTAYLMNPGSLWDIQYSRDEMKNLIMKEHKSPLLGEDYENLFDFEKGWLIALYHIGETYRRLKLYRESLDYFNKAIAIDEAYYSPYIGLALAYYALGERQKVKENISKAESLSDALEIRYYKEILGL